ncbi:MAG: hypothetical protein JWM33_507 [Caulobacteraceae bacterium]|nr:hypothetical protein [Caulobacteraceae bacterium]
MDQQRINRLKVRAWRRGFREADLILGGFADGQAATLNEGELSAFEALLMQDDQDVYEWVIGKQQTPADFETPLMLRLRDFARNLPAYGSNGFAG